MSDKRSPPVVLAMDTLQKQHGRTVQLNTDADRPLGLVVRFPTPAVSDRGSVTEHPEEADFDRQLGPQLGSMLLNYA